MLDRPALEVLAEEIGGIPLFPKIERRECVERCYETYKQRGYWPLELTRTLKLQWFQLLSDQLPIMAIMLNRDCKVSRRLEVQAWLASYP